MRIAIMQAYFFPYLGYFQAIEAVDKYLLYENLNYIKDGWMHRNRIQGRNPSPFYFSVPVVGKSSNRKISDIQLAEASAWRRKLKNALALNYRGAPHFEETFALVEPLLEARVPTLHGFNSAIIRKLCEHLEIQTHLVADNAKYLDFEDVLDQESESLESEGGNAKKVRRVLHICREEGASMFVNAIGGTELYREAQFEEAGIDLRFVKTLPHSYQQFGDRFLPNLSILDVLMFCGREGTQQLLQLCELIRSQDLLG